MEYLLTFPIQRSIRKLQKMHNLNDVVVGMESTGHYWFNITNWLMKQGVSVVLVNPMTTKRNKENRDNSPSKNDPKDALVIADAVRRGFYTPFSPKEEAFRRLQMLKARMVVRKHACFSLAMSMPMTRVEVEIRSTR
ncbi:IS110 family transposase [Paenibacillus sp. Soil522]|uniref:IS110 family transposase n=1 Tax=Paenibacillus sp. Soil522 TaxID=1736388 RepID=UPI0006FCF243|nr:hypothetical protein ASG81_22810 [Paenibacillus sp. Soil522]